MSCIPVVCSACLPARLPACQPACHACFLQAFKSKNIFYVFSKKEFACMLLYLLLLGYGKEKVINFSSFLPRSRISPSSFSSSLQQQNSSSSSSRFKFLQPSLLLLLFLFIYLLLHHNYEIKEVLIIDEQKSISN